MSNVLVVEAEPQMRKVLSLFFNAKGYQATAVPHGVLAAQVMRHQAPDVILIDQGIPAGGIRTAQVIRLNPRYRQTPILLGMKPGPRAQMRQTLEEGLKLGIAGVLIKPYKPEQLLEKVKGCLSPNGGGKEKAAQPLSSMEVRRQIRELTDLPTLSVAQQRIIAIMSRDDEEVDVNALVGAIQSDQALTMRIMRIARSAYYGFTGNFIQMAVTYLGMPRIRQIVQSATVLEVFERKGGDRGGLDRKRFWEHSVACGLVMQRISRDNRQARHFTVGLLHDVGKLVLDFKFHEHFRAIVDTAAKEHRAIHTVEQEMLGISHTEIGQELANLWQLPNEVAESIVHHHAPSRAFRHKYLSSLVYLSDVAVRQMGIGDSGNPAAAAVEDPYAQKLHVALEEIVSGREDLVRQVGAIVSPDA